MVFLHLKKLEIITNEINKNKLISKNDACCRK